MSKPLIAISIALFVSNLCWMVAYIWKPTPTIFDFTSILVAFMIRNPWRLIWIGFGVSFFCGLFVGFWWAQRVPV